tara:strand:- start:919 stop:1116 length:198 start_codon:yes stop_codon:yes gene_type:complete
MHHQNYVIMKLSESPIAMVKLSPIMLLSESTPGLTETIFFIVSSSPSTDKTTEFATRLRFTNILW